MKLNAITSTSSTGTATPLALLARMSTVFALAMALWVAAAAPAGAQQMGIIATVNNAPISEYDLRARLELVMALSGLPRNRQTVQQLAPKVVDTLIDEELKRQEAETLGIEVSEDEVRAAVRRFEQARNMPAGGMLDMLNTMNLSEDVLYQQIRADLAWRDALRRRFRALTQVSDEEIDEELARMEAEKGKPVALLSEIFLPVDQPDKEQEVRTVANRIIGELKNGAPFQTMATTFSQSPTAAVGGDLGWVSVSSLPPEAARALATMKQGDYSDPVRSRDGFTIYWLRDQRVSQGATGPAADPQIELQQLTIPVKDVSPTSGSASELDLAKRLRLRAKSCEDMADMPQSVAGGLTADKLKLRLSQLSPLVKESIKDLPDDTPSEVVKVPGAFMLFMVCERIAENSEEVVRAKVRTRLVDARLDLAARQFMRDLRRNAFIERR